MQPTATAVHRSTRARTLTHAEKALVGLLMGALVVAIVAQASGGSSAVDTTRIRVREGDTLWSLAANHPAHGLDTARTADLIAELNGLDSSALAAGTTLKVPSATDSSLAMR